MNALARFACAAALAIGAAAAIPARAGTVAFVPLDDRPVTLALPVALGRIAGRPVVTPPTAALGHYLLPGDPDAILGWLETSADAQGASAVVASLDMVAYGGLVASRVPGEPAFVAYTRLRRLAALGARLPVSVFGTVMRLAPTGVPRAPQTAHYWATGDVVDEIAEYANLPVPARSQAERDRARALRSAIGPATLDAYLVARARNVSVDQYALQLAAEGGFREVVLGQDDAGPQGLHVADLAALGRTAARFGLGARAAVEPGADELGMVLLAREFARGVSWVPAVRVRYSRADAGATVDPLEYAPIAVTIDKLITACGARSVASPAADVDLFVYVAGTSAQEQVAFVDAVAGTVAAGRSAAVADLSFLAGPMPNAAQQALTRALIERGIAGHVDAFASWNTDANTVGTALGAAIAAGAGRRSGRYDARAHAQFMLDRYADDYAFHQFVRPVLNADLRSQGIDTTLLFTPLDAATAAANRALLWPLTLDLLRSIYPDYRDAGLTITLPWQRTFETELDVQLAPAP